MKLPSPTRAACAALFLLAASAAAADQPGMVVVRDPVTGELRAPTPAESRALRLRNPDMQPDTSSAPVSRRADGSRKAHLGTRRQVSAVLTRDADGKPVMHCVQSEAALDAVLQRAPAAAAVPVKPAKEHDHENE